MARLKEMLDRIEKPMAIFASDDIVGFRLLDALHQMEIRVPGSVAVLGVNDDEFRCTLSSPPLSSVRLAGEEVGRRGAALLQQMIDGGERPDGPVLLPPLDVRVRQSTSIYAVADEDVRAALNFIHDRALEPIDVEAILDAVPIARRTLEKRFKAVLGRTLMSHVNHVRIQRAKELLLDTDWSMLRIALHCGFRNSHRFSEVFRRLTGQTPSAFRNPGS
jgi:LacI family transcriptional regulator